MAMRFPKTSTYKLADRLGARVEWDDTGSVFTIRIAAPRGQHWNDGATHELRIEARPTTPAQRDDLWIDALRRMEAGLVECDLNNDTCADWALD